MSKPPAEPTIQVCLRVSPELRRAVKVAAIEAEISLTQFVIEALEAKLKRNASAA